MEYLRIFSFTIPETRFLPHCQKVMAPVSYVVGPRSIEAGLTQRGGHIGIQR